MGKYVESMKDLIRNNSSKKLNEEEMTAETRRAMLNEFAAVVEDYSDDYTFYSYDTGDFHVQDNNMTGSLAPSVIFKAQKFDANAVRVGLVPFSKTLTVDEADEYANAVRASAEMLKKLVTIAQKYNLTIDNA